MLALWGLALFFFRMVVQSRSSPENSVRPSVITPRPSKSCSQSSTHSRRGDATWKEPTTHSW